MAAKRRKKAHREIRNSYDVNAVAAKKASSVKSEVIE